MAKPIRRSGLGRGLDSLMGISREEVGAPQEEPVDTSQRTPVTNASPFNVEMLNNVEQVRNHAEDDNSVGEVVSSTVSSLQGESSLAQATVVQTEGDPGVPGVSLGQEDNSVVDEGSQPVSATAGLSSAAGEAIQAVPAEDQPDGLSSAPAAAPLSESPKEGVRAMAATGEVPLEMIVPNPNQPRTYFKEEEIDELAASIDKEGLLQPILVRRVENQYQIVAGERRWQACKKLQLERVVVRVIDADEEKSLELALIENIQREDLNPIEEARGYRRLMESRGMTQSEVAEVVSKGRSTIANALRLLELPEEAQQLLSEDKITAGHARAILSVPTPEGRKILTRRLVEEKLSVRDAEDLARKIAAGDAPAKAVRTREPIPAVFKKAALGLREKLKTDVKVKAVGGKHRIEITVKDEDELKRLFGHLLGE